MDITSLSFPIPYLPCILDTDASGVAIGAVLSQKVDNEEHPIAFFSQVMNPAQKQYCTTRRELLAVISALQHFRHYLIGNKVILRTDHYSLKWLKTFKIPEGIMARWIETLAEFDIEIKHQPGLVHSNVDGVSRPFCKQCEGKVSKTRWIDELEYADELTEPLSVNRIIFLPEITDDQIKELQAKDPDLGHIIEWMKDGQRPTPDYLKSKSLDTRTLWAQVPAIHLLDGIIVHKFSDESMIQLVVLTALRRRLFELTHAGPLAAHLGPQITLQQLRALYYWPNMNRDVQLWYRQCQICVQAKGPPSRHQARLRKIVTGAPMDIVTADILSGVPVTEDRLRYILVLTDYFTKWHVPLYYLTPKRPHACASCMMGSLLSLVCPTSYTQTKAETSSLNCSMKCAS